MLLNQLLISPKSSARLLVCDPFRMPDEGELVKEVIGLANANVDGPRYILFGVNAAAMEGSGIVGIAESAMTDLKKAHRLISSLIEPVLHLAFIFDRINGKLVGALEVDGCDDGPYVVGRNFSEKLSHGRCWIREGRNLRAVERDDLAIVSESEPDEEPDEEPNEERTQGTEAPSIEVGFNDQPDCKLIEMPLHDTSNPPFGDENRKIEQPLDLKKVITNTIETVTAQVLRLRRLPGHDDVESDEVGAEEKTDGSDEAESLFSAANNHYFFEEKALQLNLSVCNKGAVSVGDVRLKLGFPRIPGFDIADRIYVSPFDKRSTHKNSNRGYPDVHCCDDSIIVYSPLAALEPDVAAQAFKCPLRLAVGPEMQGRKIAIRYSLRGQNNRSLGKGLLKIKFGKIAA